MCPRAGLGANGARERHWRALPRGFDSRTPHRRQPHAGNEECGRFRAGPGTVWERGGMADAPVLETGLQWYGFKSRRSHRCNVQRRSRAFRHRKGQGGYRNLLMFT